MHNMYFKLNVLFGKLLCMTKQTGHNWIKEGLPCRVVKGVEYIEIHEAIDLAYKNKPYLYYRALCDIEELWRDINTKLYETDRTLTLIANNSQF